MFYVLCSINVWDTISKKISHEDYDINVLESEWDYEENLEED